MILHWDSLKEDHPTAVSIIEGVTGFKYDTAYGALMNEGKPIDYAHMEGFMDDHGWYMTVYPTEFPGWNGIITDRNGTRIFDAPEVFRDVRSRNHAKSLLAGIAIKMFDKKVLEITEIHEDAVILDRSHLVRGADTKSVDQLQYSDFNLDGQGLISGSSMAVYMGDKQSVVIKNTEGFPEPGMVIPSDHVRQAIKQNRKQR